MLMDPDKRAFVLARLAEGSPLRAVYLDVRRRGWTPLMQAARDGDEDAAARAIADGVDVDAIAERADSALMLACAAGHEAIVARLLAAGADPTVRSRKDTTVLHYAVAHTTSLVRRLLDAGAPITADRDGMSPLVAAIELDRLDSLALLLATLPPEHHMLTRAFEYACGRGRLAAMRLLCEHSGTGLATASNDPLYAAVVNDQLEAVRFVLDAGAAVESYDIKDERSALMHAASAGHYEVAELLLARGADPNEQTEWFVTAPRLAIQRGDARMFALLRAHGAEEQEPVDYQLSVLAQARRDREAEQEELAGPLATDDVIAVARIVDAGLHLGTAITEAARVGAVHTTAYLLAIGAKPPVDRPSALELAIAASAGHVVRLLLALRPTWDRDRIAAAAVNQADPWLLADLLEAGVPADHRVWGTPLIHTAAQAGRWRHVEVLLDHGASLADDLNGSCPLSLAAAMGHRRCVDLLAAREPAGRVVETERGSWPRPHTGMRRLDHALLEAARHPRTIEILIRRGADPLARDSNGESLLHRGARGAAAIDLHLRLARSYLDSPGRLGWTPLHNAAMANTPAVIAALVGAGAGIDIRDPDGQTPLHVAATYPRAGIVDALLVAGADPHIRDKDGHTPLACAEAVLTRKPDDALVATTVERLRAAR